MRSEQFEEFLQEDLSWRKKEISELYMLASLNNNVESLLKSMILIIYAHWEGYIKKSSKLYMKYVVEEKIRVQELTSNFKAIALKDSAKRCIETSDNLTLANEFQLINHYSSIDGKKFKITIDPDDDITPSIIDTHNNLKPKVFKNIINIIGLRYHDPLETRENYISSCLLANRNAIGHGSRFDQDRQEDFSLTIEDVTKLKDFIMLILDFFTDVLLDYKEKKFYLSCNEEQKVIYDDEQEKILTKKLEELEEEYAR